MRLVWPKCLCLQKLAETQDIIRGDGGTRQGVPLVKGEYNQQGQGMGRVVRH